MNKCLETKESCKEHNCAINRRNIRAIYNPEGNPKKNIVKKSNKACDCIIECDNGQIIIIEILCGRLTFREYKDKLKQLESCIDIVEQCKRAENIRKVILIYKKLDANRNSEFKKKIISNKKIRNNYTLETYQKNNFEENFNRCVC